jgi:hypothetical protein
MEYELAAYKADVLIPEDQFEPLARKAHFPGIENIPRAVIKQSVSVPWRIIEIIKMREEIDHGDDQKDQKYRLFDVCLSDIQSPEFAE